MAAWDGKVQAPNGSRHWLENDGHPFIAVWHDHYADGSGLVWHVAGTAYSANLAQRHYAYLGPCLMPEEVAAALAAARREGARAAQVADGRGKIHEVVTLLAAPHRVPDAHSRAEEAVEIAAGIRALMDVPGDTPQREGGAA